MTQNRPVPSLVVFGSLTERRTAGRERVAGAHRLVEHDRVVAHHRFRQAEALLQVEVHLQRQRRLASRPGAQWCGRNHTDSIVGGAIGPPVSSAATSSSQNSGLPFSTDAHDGPDVAALDRELAGLLVLHLVDQRVDVGGQVVGRPSRRRLLPRAARRSRRSSKPGVGEQRRRCR